MYACTHTKPLHRRCARWTRSQYIRPGTVSTKISIVSSMYGFLGMIICITACPATTTITDQASTNQWTWALRQRNPQDSEESHRCSIGVRTWMGHHCHCGRGVIFGTFVHGPWLPVALTHTVTLGMTNVFKGQSLREANTVGEALYIAMDSNGRIFGSSFDFDSVYEYLPSGEVLVVAGPHANAMSMR